MSDSVRPQRRHPSRLPRPWNSLGKNTGVGCHFLLQCMGVKSEVKSLSCVQLFMTSWTAAHQAPLSMGFARQEYWSEFLPNSKWLLKTSLCQSCTKTTTDQIYTKPFLEVQDHFSNDEMCGICRTVMLSRTFQVTLVVKNPLANTGDIREADSIPGQEDRL